MSTEQELGGWYGPVFADPKDDDGQTDGNGMPQKPPGEGDGDGRGKRDEEIEKIGEAG